MSELTTLIGLKRVRSKLQTAIQCITEAYEEYEGLGNCVASLDVTLSGATTNLYNPLKQINLQIGERTYD